MKSDFQIILDNIRKRRSIYPHNFKQGAISQEIINDLVEAARWAPNHKMTEPWRFVIFTEDGLNKLSKFLGEYYRSNTSQEAFSQEKMQKAAEKPLQSGAVIAICITRSPEAVIPSWEETAAVACAVQNLWLTASAHQLGGYWSTPAAISELVRYFELKDITNCLGLFYLGWPTELPNIVRKRKAIEEISFYIK
ncbi:MAG: nitroreductase [Saprospiraceae bacterium]